MISDINGRGSSPLILLGNEPDRTEMDNLAPAQLAKWYHDAILPASSPYDAAPYSNILDQTQYTYRKCLPGISQFPNVSFSNTPDKNPFAAGSSQAYMWEFFYAYFQTYGSFPPYDFVCYHAYASQYNSGTPTADAMTIDGILRSWEGFWTDNNFINVVGQAPVKRPGILTECGPNGDAKPASDAYMTAFTVTMVRVLESHLGLAQAWCAFIGYYDSEWGSICLLNSSNATTAYGLEYQHQGELDVQLLTNAADLGGQNISAGASVKFYIPSGTIDPNAGIAFVQLGISAAHAGDYVQIHMSGTGSAVSAFAQQANVANWIAGAAPVLTDGTGQYIYVYNGSGTGSGTSETVWADVIVCGYA